MKLTLIRLLAVSALALSLDSCTYNSYPVETPPIPVIVATTPSKPKTTSYTSSSSSYSKYDKPAAVGGGYGGSSPESFHAVQKPSTYSAY